MAEDTNVFGSGTGDADAKNILKFRAVLASILKYAIPEYSILSWESILSSIPISDNAGGSDLYVREDNSEDLDDRKHIDFAQVLQYLAML